ncbi:MAG: CDP-diacylglycerol--serine O-phosphatidyltransferase [Nitrospirota bacterium]|nr:CDP-diacylglycerol--serine O-phosphatidyltransferase [Nitrospirota bacterium]
MHEVESRRRGVHLIPNLLTTCNIIAGFYCIVSAFHDRFEQAAFAIVAAGVFDILDGRVARAMGGGSRFGVEYDSLADMISFGMAPALLMYTWALNSFGRVGWAVACLYVICAALRLARFNVSQMGDPATKSDLFTGLPSPGAAGMICTLVLFQGEYGLIPTQVVPMIALPLVFFLSFLLVSNVPYGRGAQREREHPFLNLVSGALVLVAIVAKPHLALFIIGVLYTTSGLVGWARHGFRTRRSDAAHRPADTL